MHSRRVSTARSADFEWKLDEVRAPAAGPAKHRSSKPVRLFLVWAAPAGCLLCFRIRSGTVPAKGRRSWRRFPVTPAGDLLARHVEAGIEVRIVTNLNYSRVTV
jgi:hypothetical protein